MRRRYRKLRRKKQKSLMRNTIIVMVVLTLGFATGYSAFSTDITLNAKGNIKQKSFGISKLKEKVVTVGDGLYSDSLENEKYIYRGENPNNYITIGNEEYRIMAIEANNVLKIIKNESIGSIPWDPGYETSISGTTEANSVIGTRYSNSPTDFCYKAAESEYGGCKAWGSKSTTLDSNGNNVTTMPRETGSSNMYNLPENEAYVNTYLNTIYLNTLLTKIDTDKREYILNHNFNIGIVKHSSSQTLATDMSQESSYKWQGKVGLMTATDFVKASTNSACTSIYNYTSISNCYSNSATYNYLTKQAQWTLTPNGNDYRVWYAGLNVFGYRSPYFSQGVYPVLFLSSDIKLKGFGTQSNPYYIADE